jgi:8-oxo-dGTP diphosphatase
MGEKLFNVGAKAIIVKDNKVLIAQDPRGFWEVPGGRIDKNETIEEALHRELREELPNIKAIVLHEVVDARRLHKDIKDDVSLVLVFYKVEADFDGEPQLSHEHQAYKWATKDEALKLVYETCRVAIEKVLS